MKSPEYRKKMRIEKLKRHKMQQRMIDENTETINPYDTLKSRKVDMTDPSLPDWKKNTALKEIESMREYTKGHTIEKVLAGHIKSLQHMYVTPGKP